MNTLLLLELFAGFLAAGMALWFVLLSRSPQDVDRSSPPMPAGYDDDSTPCADPATSGPLLSFAGPWALRLRQAAAHYLLAKGPLASTGLLLLRLAIGVMMIHHGQEKLADPQQFADTYVASLHLPFPLFFAYAAGFSELLGSWLLILGLLSPLGALAITGTMAVAAYQHILTAGLNIYVLELVVLYLGGSVALLLLGPGRFSFDGAMLVELLAGDGALAGSLAAEIPSSAANPKAQRQPANLVPAYLPLTNDARS